MAKRAAWLGLLACVSSGLAGSPASAAPPWQKMMPFIKRVEADPNKSYALTENQGPWLIVATTFVGENAEENAQELTLELRKRFKLLAYTHRKRFDFTEGATRGQQKLRYRTNTLEEVAVLVGDYSSIDDSQAQETLRLVKTCKPNCMQLGDNEKDARPMAEFRKMLWNATPRTDPRGKAKYGATLVNNKKYLGPMANAMLTTNPLLPDEYFAPKGVDRFVVEMNKDVKHNLLNNPGKFTVKVATFSGASVIDQAKIKEIQKGKDAPSRLAEAAEKAHKLTETLRSQGYEAYEFHDRGQSIVTVGSFNSVGSPRADGKVEIDPKIHTIIATFGAASTPTPTVANAVGAGTPKVFGGIPTDIYPSVVEVPRKSIGSDYAERGLLGRR